MRLIFLRHANKLDTCSPSIDPAHHREGDTQAFAAGKCHSHPQGLANFELETSFQQTARNRQV